MGVSRRRDELPGADPAALPDGRAEPRADDFSAWGRERSARRGRQRRQRRLRVVSLRRSRLSHPDTVAVRSGRAERGPDALRSRAARVLASRRARCAGERRLHVAPLRRQRLPRPGPNTLHRRRADRHRDALGCRGQRDGRRGRCRRRRRRRVLVAALRRVELSLAGARARSAPGQVGAVQVLAEAGRPPGVGVDADGTALAVYLDDGSTTVVGRVGP